MAARVRWRPSSRARDVVRKAGRPGLSRAGRSIGKSIVDEVPVRSGVVRGTYSPTVIEQGDSVHVAGFGSFWHLLEYGTAYTPAYRPIARGVQAAGLRFEAH